MGADWITWRNNPSSGSHMGGVWEFQIRSARAILLALMKQHVTSLNDESLVTFLVDVEYIIKSRPLTVETLSDMGSEAPLCPNNLLTMKTNVALPPPIFSRPDLNSRRRRRRVQHIANKFWCRCRKEFLVTLQNRGKWNNVRRDFQVGGIILLKDNTTGNRCQWLKLSKHVKEAMVMLEQLKYKLVTALSIMRSYLRRCFVEHTKFSCWLKIKWFNSCSKSV